ncbi:MAG: sterol desaturase family protein [Candidatus Omnitrophica bacterium]|nr:hypothetical protein [bacterium]NUN97171.1 sterol desaturase family protein [Candidatus Omnitrophota bacterium]
MAPFSFLSGLIVLSILFALLERLRPWRREQRVWRKNLVADLFYLILNGHLIGVLVASVSPSLVYLLDLGLETVGLSRLVSLGLVSEWTFWGQFAVVFFGIDFLQWCIHNLLHRVPFLWNFHKTHHSITEMDWIGHMKFHWMEGLIYRTLLFAPFAFLDVRPEVLFWFGLFTLAMGYFNHSNLAVDIGPLGYFFNNPRMHLWHHTHPDCGPTNRNFGLNLSLWDWVFGTAHQPPDIFPERLGLAWEDDFPDALPMQLIYPIKTYRHGSGHPS